MQLISPLAFEQTHQSLTMVGIVVGIVVGSSVGIVVGGCVGTSVGIVVGICNIREDNRDIHSIGPT